MNIGDVTLTLSVVNAKFLQYVSPDGEFTFTVARQKRHGFPVSGKLPQAITLSVWVENSESEAAS